MRTNFFLQYILFFTLFTLVVPGGIVFASVSQSTGYQLINGQINPISGPASNNKTIKGGGHILSGRASGNNYNTRQGSIFGFITQTQTQQTPTQGQVQVEGGPRFASSKSPDIKFNPKIKNLSVTNITTNSSKIILKTKENVRASLRYGREGKSTTATPFANNLVRNHKFLLKDLKPSSNYLFQLILENSQNQNYISDIFNFTTLPVYNTPPSVSNFEINSKEGALKLNWDNPEDSDYKNVKVVKSKNYFPNNVENGKVVYTGNKESYTDTEVNENKNYYYAIFTIDEKGDASSSVVESFSFQSSQDKSVRGNEKKITKTSNENKEKGTTSTDPRLTRKEEKTKTSSGNKEITSSKKRQIKAEIPGEGNQTNKRKEQSEEGVGGVPESTSTILAKPPPVPTTTQQLKSSSDEVEDNMVVYTFLKQRIRKSTSSNGFITKTIPHTIRATEEKGDWSVFSNSKALLTISSGSLSKPVKSIVVTIADESYTMNYNRKEGNYEVIMETPAQSDRYEMLVQIFYSNGTYEQISNKLVIERKGRVFKEKFKNWSWKKPWQIFFKQKVPVSKAEITLYSQTEEGKWEKWPSSLYNQYNPHYTQKDGSYSIVAPPGKYYLKINKNGYKEFTTNKFKLEDKTINKKVTLKKKENWVWLPLYIFGIIFISLMVYFIYRKNNSTLNEDGR